MSGTQNLWIGNFNSNDGAIIRLNNNIPTNYNPYLMVGINLQAIQEIILQVSIILMVG